MTLILYDKEDVSWLSLGCVGNCLVQFTVCWALKSDLVPKSLERLVKRGLLKPLSSLLCSLLLQCPLCESVLAVPVLARYFSSPCCLGHAHQITIMNSLSFPASWRWEAVSRDFWLGFAGFSFLYQRKAPSSFCSSSFPLFDTACSSFLSTSDVYCCP